MRERLYIEITDADEDRTVSVPRQGAVVTESSIVQNRKQVPYVTLRYSGVVLRVVGVERRDVVDALESGVDIYGSWSVLTEAGLTEQQQVDLLTEIMGEPNDDPAWKTAMNELTDISKKIGPSLRTLSKTPRKQRK